MGIGKVLEVFTGNILRIKYGHDVQSLRIRRLDYWLKDARMILFVNIHKNIKGSTINYINDVN